MIFLSRTLPVIVAFCFGMLGIAIYYVPHASAQNIERELALWLRIVFAFSYLLGLYSLLNLHWQRIRQRVAGWGYSVVVYIGFSLMMFFVVYNDSQGPFAPQAEGGGYQWIFEYVHVACSSTMFSILAFFIASAAYRTFRARTPEAALLLVAAVIVMLGRVPIGAYISDYIPAAAEWLLKVPNLAAKRGILLGVSLGAIATSLRIIFGIERSYLGGGEQ
ncbi:MAG: uncharacterized membrane protein YhaH (DUF805 family) [Candidatus Latescibacterota bacterium]|jgi:uncharacterized membrane protein YhaH (DUF805 family)